MDCSSGASSCSCLPHTAGTAARDGLNEMTSPMQDGDDHRHLPVIVQSESELIIIGVLLALVLVLALTSMALCLQIQALKQRQRRHCSGRFDLRTEEEDVDSLGGQVVPRERRLEEEEVSRYSEASCSTPSSGFQSDSLDSRGGGAAEQMVHLLQPAADSGHDGGIMGRYAVTSPSAVLKSPRLKDACRHASAAYQAAGQEPRQDSRSPDTHLDEALRLLQMTTNHLQREP